MQEPEDAKAIRDGDDDDVRVLRDEVLEVVAGGDRPADLEAAWVPPRRTLQQSLVIGSKLDEQAVAERFGV